MQNLHMAVNHKQSRSPNGYSQMRRVGPVRNSSPRQSPRHSPPLHTASPRRISPQPPHTPVASPSSSTVVNDFRCVRISGLRHQTIAATVRNAFARWGQVERVELGLDGNESPDGTAIILFRERPWHTEFLKHATIDGRPIKVEVVNESIIGKDRLFRDRRKSHYTRVPARRISLGTKTGPKEYVEEWFTEESVAMIIQYDRRMMQIFFNSQEKKFKLEFSFKDMTNGELLMERDGQSTYFTIQLKYPARFWIADKEAVQESKTSVTVGHQWKRVIDLPMIPNMLSEEIKGITEIKSIHLQPNPNNARLGVWTTYRIKFTPAPRAQQEFEDMLSEASEYNLVPRNTSMLLPILNVVSAKVLPRPILHIDRCKIFTSFDTLYMIEALIHSYQFNERNLKEDFYEAVGQIDGKIAVGIFDILFASKERTYEPLQTIAQIFEEVGVRVGHQRRIPDHCAMIRKVIVTPTTMHLKPPSVEITNRVVRHFRNYTDRFMRVQFMDDGNSKLNASQSMNREKIYNRFFRTLRKGIVIGNRRYEFLAFSSSQLREHGCWFFAPTPELNADDIRNWMGSFQKEKIIAKHAVRMGQCFSSTQSITELQEDEIDYIDDVVRNGYTFSDGVGLISRALAEDVATALGLSYIPSAFQFRFGGAKGVLSKSPTLLKGRRIQLRPSQIKFESNHYELEVIRVSSLIPAYLNRQAILLLSTLGVPDEVFMKKMQVMIDAMNRMLGDPTQAIKTVLTYVDEYGTARSMAKIIQAGFLEKRDPYILNLINMFRVSLLKDLKKKAKILVHKGAFLLGIMDETRTLQEGEIFCQISGASNKGRGKKIIQGDVVVYRNPCFHPGDVRVVKAVDNPKLHHLTDVIVFSALGYRDIPSMCSGGDLDGDDYTIFWDDELLPKMRNYEPMEYKADAPAKKDSVNLLHIHAFFINYMTNDNLGAIANAHLATADRSPKGALDGNCLRLAQKHSMAVDYPKTGKPAELDEDLRVRIFPDFMQKKDKESYESQKVLGKIYRAIDKSDYKEYKAHLVDATTYDVRLRVPEMERYIQEARELKAEYGRDITSLMNQYGVQTEAEIVSGYIIKWLKETNKNSKHEIHKQTMHAVLTVKKQWRERFEQNLPEEPGARHAKAAAWYYVTYHPDERMKDLSVEGNLLSFPWVMDDLICEIAIMNNNRVAAEDQAKPVDDALVRRLANAQKQDLQFTMVYSSDEGDNDDDSDNEDEEEQVDANNGSGEEEEEDDDDDTQAIKSFVLSAKPQQQKETPKTPKISPEIVNNQQHTSVSANATEEELADVLLG